MNIYEQLGLKTVINGCGTVTKLGGSKMDARVLDAMVMASKSFVEISALHKAAGAHIAKLLGCQACCITGGAAAGIAICAAACMNRGHPAKKLQLPDTTGMPNEAIILKSHRTLYDQALALSGIKIIEVGAASYAIPEQVEAAISDKTALFFYSSEAESTRGSIAFEKLVALFKKHNIPIVVDAAAEVPPKSNITKHLELGADLVIFSGGKEIRGPQSSGLILGRKDLIEAAAANCCPHDSIGRPMKIDKETIAGITKAVELFIEKDYDVQMSRWSDMSNQMAQILRQSERAEIRTGYPQGPGIQPVEILRVYVKPLNQTTQSLYDRLLELDPQIYTGLSGDEIAINPQCLEDEELKPITDAILALL